MVKMCFFINCIKICVKRYCTSIDTEFEYACILLTLFKCNFVGASSELPKFSYIFWRVKLMMKCLSGLEMVRFKMFVDCLACMSDP